MSKNLNSMLFLTVFLLFLSNPVLADNFTCLDTNTSRFDTTIIVSGTSIPITYNDTCNNQCNNATGKCNLDSFDTAYLILFLIFPIIAFVLLYFVSLLKSEDWVIHMLLMIAAIAFLVAPLGILQGMQQAANNAFLGIPISGLYMFVVVVMIIVIFYYMLKILVGVVKLMGKGKNNV